MVCGEGCDKVVKMLGNRHTSKQAMSDDERPGKSARVGEWAEDDANNWRAAGRGVCDRRRGPKELFPVRHEGPNDGQIWTLIAEVYRRARAIVAWRVPMREGVGGRMGRAVERNWVRRSDRRECGRCWPLAAVPTIRDSVYLRH